MLFGCNVINIFNVMHIIISVLTGKMPRHCCYVFCRKVIIPLRFYIETLLFKKSTYVCILHSWFVYTLQH